MLSRTGVAVPLFLLACVSAFAADSGNPLAPLPTQLAAARKVFISNMGGECQDFNSPGFLSSGQPLHHGQISPNVPKAYDAFYSAIKAWGRFDVVLAPADADLAFQIHVICPTIKEGHPVLEMQVLDPRSRISLWGFQEIADPAELQKNRDANFLRALNRLTQDVKDLFSRADATPVSSTK